MADIDIYLGEGDTGPSFRYQLLVPVEPDDPLIDQYPERTKPADLTGATVTFKMRIEDQTASGFTVPVAVESPPTGGWVNVTWAGYSPGARYVGRFKGVMGNGQRISFLNNRLLTIEVTADP